MSFWSADEKIPVQQTKVNIPAEHGLDYSAGQVININIPPTIKYFQPRESYLRCDVQLKVDSTHPVKLSLDGEIGAQVLIRDIHIYSGGSGAVLLEELQNYNTLVALQYDYETNDSIKNKRAMTEGSLCYSQENRSTLGNVKTVMNQTRHNPYHTPYDAAIGVARTKAGDGALNWGAAGNVSQGSQYELAKVLIPLHTGIFQSPKVFPSLLTEGLRIEILLEDAQRVVRLPDTIHPNRKRSLGLQFHSVNGVDDNIDDATGMWADAAATTDFYVQRTNNITNLQNCPLVIGQKIQLYKWDAWDGATGWAGQTKRMKTDKDMIIAGLEFMGAQGDTATAGGIYGLLKITMSGAVTSATGEDVDSSWFVKDDSILETAFATGIPSNSVLTPTYEIKNVELILQTLTMPAGYTQKLMNMMSAGGAMNYDFLSFTNYKYSQLAGDRVMNMRLPLNQTKAKAILCIPTDASVYSARQAIAGEDTTGTYQNPGVAGVAAQYPSVSMPTNLNYVEDLDKQDFYNVSCRSSLVGIADEITDYQMFYNGQLNPSRRVECEKISRRVGVQQQQLIELEKALAMSGINPLSFMKYKENFCIGRALALQQGVYNTVGRDFNVQINYQSTTAPVKPKLWCNYVSHIRRLMVQGDSVVIQV
tara:strand:- start:5 stop:1945 length:1941 start_codon:yes stop_codon:yes gene_type:complete